MDQILKRRYKQLIKGAILESKKVAKLSGRSRLSIIMDMVSCFRNHYVFTKQYREQKLWELSAQEKKAKAELIGKENLRIDAWTRDYFENRAFINEYSSMKYELSKQLMRKRYAAYAKRYNAGKGLIVQYGVDLCRSHGLEGTIKIGDNVVFAKNCFIDYSGEVVIANGAKFANGVIIETHHRDLEAYNDGGRNVNVPTKLYVGENAYVGSRAIILDSCNYIGKCARIGAGAVITKDVPDYSVVVGVPGKVVKVLPHDE